MPQMAFDLPKFNSTHTIMQMKFGAPAPGQAFPLENVTKVAEQGELTSFDYYLQLVPTEYQKNVFTVLTHQYSVTEFAQKAGVYNGALVPPGVTLKYDFSPLKVYVKEEKRTFLQFVTSVCAIIGGTFSVAGLISATVFKTSQLLKKPKPGRAAE